MKVKLSRNVATVTMTPDQLLILRYALNVGVEKLEQTHSFFKARKIKEAGPAGRTARKARRAFESLELATRRLS